MEIVDAHVHFIDPSRPKSTGFPAVQDSHLVPAWMPHDLRALAAPLGVRGAIAIENSSRYEDTQWLLELADADPFVAGVVGNLGAGSPGFDARLARAAQHPRFLGVRVGTPWCPLDVQNPQLIADLQALAAAGLALDVVTVGGGGVPLLETVLTLNERFPALRIVVDHLPFGVADADRERYGRALRDLAPRSNVYAKISNVLPRSGPIPSDPVAYRPMLDELVAAFGPDRVIYASNWPVSTRVAPYDRAFTIVREYFAAREPELAAKFFATNARAAYRP